MVVVEDEGEEDVVVGKDEGEDEEEEDVVVTKDEKKKAEVMIR